MNSHEFAFWAPEIADAVRGSQLSIIDENMLHRLIKVVRVEPNDTIVIFGKKIAHTCTIEHIAAKKISCAITKSMPIKPLTPHIDWLLPLISKEAFEEAIRMLTVLGARTIQPVVTATTKRSKLDHARLERLMIAAAEQSKQFALPTILPPLEFATAVAAVKTDLKLFFDPTGVPLQSIFEKQIAHLTCMVGPEADLRDEEKKILDAHQFARYALTPSILRSEDAVTVAMGTLRTVLR